MKQVAEEAGVHASTVSRALNAITRPMVVPSQVERVLKAAKSLATGLIQWLRACAPADPVWSGFWCRTSNQRLHSYPGRSYRAFVVRRIFGAGGLCGQRFWAAAELASGLVARRWTA